MVDVYANYAALAAAEVEGVDYTRTVVNVAGATWGTFAIHGGGIEPGSGEVARAVAVGRMAHYEFAGIKSSGNSDLHITSTNFDEPQALALIAASQRALSFHGYVGTGGVAETAIGGLDARLRDAVSAALTSAGFTVITAASEIDGADTTNFCNKTSTAAGVQLEMSQALRESFFPGGDTSRAMRDSGQRTATFDAYVAAIRSVMIVGLTYDGTLSRVRLATVAPGVRDAFGRTTSNGWGDSDSGHVWLRSGGVASDYSVSSGLGRHNLGAVNSARWSLTGKLTDFDFTVTAGTSALAAGGSHFVHAVARSTDDGTTCYLARLEFTTAAAINLTIRKRVAGTETLLSSTVLTGLTHVAGTQYAIRFQGVGTALKARAWLAAGIEPATWGAELTDASVTAAGRIGCRSILSASNSNSLPVTATWDGLRTLGTATVQRSTNGLRWTTVRGGTTFDGDAGETIGVDDYEFPSGVRAIYRIVVSEPLSGAVLFTEADSFTAAITGVWLKSITRPFLNRQVKVVDHSDITRPARNGVFEVIGRTYPVAVTDVRSSRRWTYELYADTVADADAIDLVFASGDPLFVQVPAGSTVPTGYVVVGDVRRSRYGKVSARRYFDVPVTEVAPPGADIVGATVTWEALVAEFGTWNDVLAAFGSWVEVAEYVADPETVIVP